MWCAQENETDHSVVYRLSEAAVSVPLGEQESFLDYQAAETVADENDRAVFLGSLIRM